MKHIKVKFVDFGKNSFREELIVRILKERYEVVYSDAPDYLFYSVFSDTHLKYKDAVRIFVTTENLAPDYNLCDYSIDYEWMEYGDRHLRFPIYGFDGYSDMYKLCCEKESDIDDSFMRDKTEFCSFVYSNNEADPFRTVLFEKINKYKKVNSGGRYMNNIGKPNGVENKLDFQKKHKFCIACENSRHPGYTTEKLVEAFAAKSVPIYWGDPLVKKVFNLKAFICVDDFETVEECVEYIRKVDNDDELYMSMLKEPAVIAESENSPDLMLSSLKAFLYNIMDVDKENAYRRNRVFWGNMYFEKQKRWKRVFDICTLNFDNSLVKKLRNIVFRNLKKC